MNRLNISLICAALFTYSITSTASDSPADSSASIHGQLATTHDPGNQPKGEIQSIYVMIPAIEQDIASGTKSAPIRKMGPSFRVSRLEELNTDQCSRTYNNNECNAAIVGASRSTASDLMQTTGLIGVAVGEQVNRISGESLDAVGTQGQGRVINKGVGVATGGFFQGIDESPQGRAIGLESNIKNLSGHDATPNIVNGDSFPNLLASCGAGTWKPQYKCNSGLQVTNSGSNYNYGVVITNAVDIASFVDNSDSKIGLLLAGKHIDQVKGRNFELTGNGELYLGDTSKTGNAGTLNVFARQGSAARLSTADKSAPVIDLSTPTPDVAAAISFSAGPKSKWLIEKSTSNSLDIYDVDKKQNAISIKSGAGVYLANGAILPVLDFKNLPKSPVPGETVFCADCRSSFQSNKFHTNGIIIVWNHVWLDSLGGMALH